MKKTILLTAITLVAAMAINNAGAQYNKHNNAKGRDYYSGNDNNYLSNNNQGNGEARRDEHDSFTYNDRYERRDRDSHTNTDYYSNNYAYDSRQRNDDRHYRDMDHERRYGYNHRDEYRNRY